jgi:hypothetical protein
LIREHYLALDERRHAPSQREVPLKEGHGPTSEQNLLLTEESAALNKIHGSIREHFSAPDERRHAPSQREVPLKEVHDSTSEQNLLLTEESAALNKIHGSIGGHFHALDGTLLRCTATISP